MKRKAAKNTTKQAENGVHGPANVDGFLHFSAQDLNSFELAQHRVTVAKMRIDAIKSERKLAAFQYEQRARTLDDEARKESDKLKSHLAALQTLQTTLCAEYKIDPSRLSYEETTGRIFIDSAPVVL